MTNRFKQFFYTSRLKKLGMVSLASLILAANGHVYANEYVEKAKGYISKNKLDSAVIELKNAVQSSPKEVLPRLLLGEIYLRKGNYAAAEKELSRALEFGGEEKAVLPLLARTLSAQGKSSDVIELVQNSNLTESYAKTELLALKAAAEIQLGMIEEAKYSLELAQEYSYDSLYLQLGLARISAVNNDLDSALTSVNKILEKTKDNSDVWLLKGHLETGNQNFAEATQSYQKAYEISPDAIYYSLFIADSMVREKRFDEAEALIDKLLSLSPNHILVNKLKAVILYNRKDYEQAKRHADKALQNGLKDVSTELISAISAYNLKLFEQAYKGLKRVEPKIPENQTVKKLLISTQVALGYIDEAIDTMNKYSIESDSDRAFLSVSSVKLSELGREEEALTLAHKASKSGNASNDLMLGLVQLSANDSAGIENLQSAIKGQPDTEKAQLGIAQYYVKYGFYEEAKNAVKDLLILNPENVGAIILKGQIFQAEKDYNSAKTEYNKALTLDPQNNRALLSLAQAHANLQEWQQSYDIVYPLFTSPFYSKSIEQILILSSLKLDKMPDTLALVNSQLDASPNEMNLILMKSQLLVLSKRASEGINLLETLPEVDKTPETWKLIGQFYYQEQKWYDAEKSWEKWLELSPLSVDAYLRNVHIKEKTGKLGAGSKLAERAEKLFPNDVRFRLMRASFAFNSGDVENSQKLLDSLDENVKNTPVALKLQGLISAVQEDYALMVSVYEKQYALTPGMNSAMQLSSAYFLNKQTEKTFEFLREVIEANPEQGKPLKMKLASLMSSVDPSGAIEVYKVIVSEEPTNFLALNNLAWIFLDEGNIKEAQLYAGQAYEHGGTYPQIADTYGYVLLRAGENNKALEVLEKAYDQMGNNPEIGLHYAESLIENNKSKLAKEVLSSITTENPELAKVKDELERKLSN